MATLTRLSRLMIPQEDTTAYERAASWLEADLKDFARRYGIGAAQVLCDRVLDPDPPRDEADIPDADNDRRI